MHTGTIREPYDVWCWDHTITK